MRQYLSTTLRFTAAGYVVFLAYRLLSLGLLRPWGPQVYAYPIAGFFNEASLVLVLATIFGGAVAGSSRLPPRQLFAPVLLVAVAAMVSHTLLDPILVYFVTVRMLGVDPSVGPEFPWDSLLLALEVRAGTVPGPEGLVWSPDVLVLDALFPLMLLLVAILNGAIGYLAGRRRTRLSLRVRTWILVLVSGGGFLAGAKLAIRVTPAEAVSLLVSFALPLVVPMAVLATLIATEDMDDP